MALLHIQGLRWVGRSFGLLLAIACALVPALPLGGYLSQPPLPFAAIWLAYGWAADGGGGWRAPVIIMALGLLQDWLSGGPLGLYALLFVGAYVLGGRAASFMRSANFLSPWMGLGVTLVGVFLLAALCVPLVLGPQTGLGAFGEALVVTGLVFPLVRPLYMNARKGNRS